MGKDLYLVAGANGSGKSTIAQTLLPLKGLVFVCTLFSEGLCRTT